MTKAAPVPNPEGTGDFLLAGQDPAASLTSMGGTSLVHPQI
ncbi:hypothetical protein [Paenibacillus tarimensis]